ncbi:type II secretion system F family protein [Achromobacter xylosoxidans]
MWLYFGMITAGLGAGWGTWRVLRPAMRGSPSLSSDLAPVPGAVPWWWRLAWPWLTGVAPALDRFCPRRWRAWLSGALMRAGLPPQVREGHVLALSVAALIGGVGLVGVAYLLLRQPVAGMVADIGMQAQWMQTPWTPVPPAASGPAWAMAGGVVAFTAALLPFAWLRRQGVARRRGIERGLPFMLDMMTLCVEAGLGACSVAGGRREWSTRTVARRVGRRAGAGPCRSPPCGGHPGHGGSLRQPAGSSLGHGPGADALGISLGPLLRAQAAQCRSERHMRAERLAMQAPVKMLLPLIGCIFPARSWCWRFPSRSSCPGWDERPSTLAAGTAQAAAGQWLDGTDAGVAVPSSARAEIGDPAAPLPGGAHLRYAARH